MAFCPHGLQYFSPYLSVYVCLCAWLSTEDKNLLKEALVHESSCHNKSVSLQGTTRLVAGDNKVVFDSIIHGFICVFVSTLSEIDLRHTSFHKMS